MIGALFKASLGCHAVLLSKQRLGHLLHARVGVAVRRAAVYVVAELRVRHYEHAYVGDRAKVHKLADSIFDAANIQEIINDPLNDA
jgi:hypothetical protein